MGFLIPSPRYPGARAWATDFRIAFGKKSKLPDGAGTAKCGDFTLILKPAADPVPYDHFGKTRFAKSSKHRVFVNCPTCQAEVPAGRAAQHKCKPVHVEPVLYLFEVYWAAPEGRVIARTNARNAGEAKRIVLKNNPQYKKYPGEVGVTQI